MLDLAVNHIDGLNKLFRECALDPKYKYFYTDGYAQLTYEPKKDTWNRMDFVHIDEDSNVKGYIKVVISRPYPKVTLGMMSKGTGLEFLGDVKEVITKLFKEHGTPRIEWAVLIGNPAEKLYDRFVDRNNGRIVGTHTKYDITMDGEICDVKDYEIIREDYLEALNDNNTDRK